MKVDPSSPTGYLEHHPVLTHTQARLVALICPLLVAIAGAAWVSTGATDRLEDLSIDWRFQARGPLPVRSDIVIVTLTEESRRALAHGEQAFRLREHLPAAVNRLADAGALVIGLDFWIEGLTDPELDAPLAEALAGANVLLGATHQAGRVKRAPGLFLESGPAEGVITVYPDGDGVLRRLPPESCLTVLDAELKPTRHLAHFPLVAALFGVLEEDATATIACAERGTTVGSRRVECGTLVDYASLDPDAWTVLTFEDVVAGRFDAQQVDGAVVLIGATRTIEDSFPTPLSERMVPGVYYHANVVAQVLDDRWFDARFSSGFWNPVISGLLGLAAGLLAWNPRRWWRHRFGTLLVFVYVAGGVLVFLGGWSWAAGLLFSRHVMVPVAGPVVVMGFALGSGLAAQWIILSAETRRLADRARRIEVLLGQSVSPSVLEAIQADPGVLERTEVREVTVMFCDLRGFTAAAGGLAPENVAALLNEYFTHITTAIFENDGFIDKFVGDEVMAVYSVPLAQADHPLRAVRTAVAIKQRLAALNRLRVQRGETPLVCGIGIHTGPAAVGHIGSQVRSNYTVVGHTVNMAARIETLTSGGEILISEAVRASLPDRAVAALWKETDLRDCPGKHKLYLVAEDGQV
ncbi:MAG: adenylate/guanylate cyclase domain-containing protein [bacterium]|nr:adenylate/guanylate cyclase domain-containing protein [bacterium]